MYSKDRINSTYTYVHTHIHYTHTRTDIFLKNKTETFYLVDTLILANQNNRDIFQEKPIKHSIDPKH